MAAKKKATKKDSGLALQPLTDSAVAFSVPKIEQVIVQPPSYNDSGVKFEGYAKKLISKDQFRLLNQKITNFYWQRTLAAIYETELSSFPELERYNFFITKIFFDGPANSASFGIQKDAIPNYLFRIHTYSSQRITDIDFNPPLLMEKNLIFDYSGTVGETLSFFIIGYYEEKP
jgi:hypothetical protein